jgi:hypothetical protein
LLGNEGTITSGSPQTSKMGNHVALVFMLFPSRATILECPAAKAAASRRVFQLDRSKNTRYPESRGRLSSEKLRSALRPEPKLHLQSHSVTNIVVEVVTARRLWLECRRATSCRGGSASVRIPDFDVFFHKEHHS